MTNEIQQTRYDRIMRRVTGIIGPGSKVAEVITELFPMLDVERVPGELLILGGTDLGVGQLSLDGGPGNFSVLEIRNPLDSGKLLTVTSVLVSSTSAIAAVAGAQAVAIGVRSFNELFRDLRRGDVTRPVGQTRLLATPALPPFDWQWSLLADTTFVLRDENAVAVLPPGFSFFVSAAQQDILLKATFLWRERPVEQSELSV